MIKLWSSTNLQIRLLFATTSSNIPYLKVIQDCEREKLGKDVGHLWRELIKYQIFGKGILQIGCY